MTWAVPDIIFGMNSTQFRFPCICAWGPDLIAFNSLWNALELRERDRPILISRAHLWQINVVYVPARRAERERERGFFSPPSHRRQFRGQSSKKSVSQQTREGEIDAYIYAFRKEGWKSKWCSKKNLGIFYWFIKRSHPVKHTYSSYFAMKKNNPAR